MHEPCKIQSSIYSQKDKHNIKFKSMFISYLSFKPWKSQCGRFVSWSNVALELLMGVLGSLQSSPRSDLKEADESISLIPLWDEESHNPNWVFEDFDDAFLLKQPPMLKVSSTSLSSSEPATLTLWLLVGIWELGPPWSSSTALTPVDMSSSAAGLSRSNPLAIFMVSTEQLPLRSLEFGSSLKLWIWKLNPLVICIGGWWELMKWVWLISELVMEFQYLFCLSSFFSSPISIFCTL